MVHAGTAAREEASDRRVVARRRDELEAALADEHRRRFDTLLAKRLAVLEPCVEEPFVGRDRLVEIGHRNAEMMDLPHPRDATRGLKLVAHRESAHRADGLGRMRVRNDVGE